MKRLKVIISQIPSEKAHSLAEDLGLDLTGVEALDIKPLEWSYSASKDNSECWVVTSKNARNACIEAYDTHGEDCMQIECVGMRTAQSMIDAGLPVKHIGNKASDLLRHPEEDGYTSVRYFCGTSRRNTIKDRTLDRGLNYTEQIVYSSTPTYHLIPDEEWSGAIFTSPLATESVVEKNTLSRTLPVMAMGEATEEAVRNLGFEVVMTPSRPLIEAILKEFNSYLRR